ncbi:hypothetical protein C0583_01365 [Candidatus Parcubacteria bacterium]|nr:MAG: hypothetical protein C0583_01365 [Candidatus Parcubacteria bacterium]
MKNIERDIGYVGFVLDISGAIWSYFYSNKPEALERTLEDVQENWRQQMVCGIVLDNTNKVILDKFTRIDEIDFQKVFGNSLKRFGATM